MMKVFHFCSCISPDCVFLDPFQCVIHQFSYYQCCVIVGDAVSLNQTIQKMINGICS